MIIFQVATAVTSRQYSLHASHATAALTLLWIFLSQTFSATLIATMHNLYPVEILSLPLRAKEMGLYSLIQGGGASAVQTYGIGVGIGKVGYKIWVVYIAYNTVQLILSYFIFPETSGLSLEIDSVFETPGVAPVKMPLDIQKAKKERAAARRDEDSRSLHRSIGTEYICSRIFAVLSCMNI